uniref:UPF0506 domain-containing protein n=1 Tax=Trichobilharzia regenti TaxID=157069 RepID=A0AA85IZH6_TRIRE|nr:unnamed protein product [Trichobilharzia regenti]
MKYNFNMKKYVLSVLIFVCISTFTTADECRILTAPCSPFKCCSPYLCEMSSLSNGVCVMCYRPGHLCYKDDHCCRKKCKCFVCI